MIASTQKKQKQQTIKKEFSFSGIGLHSGIVSHVVVEPSKENSGISFYRTDVKNKSNKIEALWFNVSATNLSTTISNKEKVSVSTIEHLMSSLSGMHVDNVNIYVDGPEIPIMDGSSKPFVELIEKSGLEIQDEYRKVIKVDKEVEVKDEDSFAKIIPFHHFSVDFEIVLVLISLFDVR